MDFLNNIRIYFGKRFLRTELTKVTRRKIPVNLKNAHNIGIIYLLNSEDDYNRVSLFTKGLQEKGKKVQVLGLYQYNRTPVFYIPKLSYDLLLPKDLDIFFRPTAPFVKQFLNEEFDILLDLSSPDNFSLHYIACLSKANFKLGRKIDDRPLPYDIMIDTKLDIDSQELIDQIVHYTDNLEFISENQAKTPKTDQPY